MAEEIKTQETEEQASVTEKFTDKLEDVAADLITKANDSSKPWYTKVALYIAALLIGGASFLCANYGDTVLSIIKDMISGFGL
jgi:hypothetical protein